MLPGSRCHRREAGDTGDIKSRASLTVLAQRGWGGTDRLQRTDGQAAPLTIPGRWVRQRHRTPTWVPQAPQGHGTVGTSPAALEISGSPCGEHSLHGNPRASLPCAQSHAAPSPAQVHSPCWVRHHPTSPTLGPFREPLLPGHSLGPIACALGCSSRSFQGAGCAAGGLSTCQGCRQRGHPTPRHRHALSPRPRAQRRSQIAAGPNARPRLPAEPTCKGPHPSGSRAGWARPAMPIPASAGQVAAGCPWEEGTATAGWNRSVKKRLLRALSRAS